MASARSTLPRPGRPHRVPLSVERLESRALPSQQGPIDYTALLATPGAYDPTEVLVRFRPGLGAADLERLLPGAVVGAGIAGVSGAYSVRLPGAVTVAQALGRLRASPLVLYAEPDQVVRTLERVPDDPDFGRLYGLRNTGQNGGTPGADVRASLAWATFTGGTAVAVADIDTGVDYDHPDLYLNIWLNQAEIPQSRLTNLTDVDGDGRFTFWDLNDPVNQGPGRITDLNGDGRVSASDVLAPMDRDGEADLGTGGWADGGDGGGDGFADDLVGWNFVANNNRPFDNNFHGTHVAGTIGAVGNDGVGVAGVNWRAQIAAVKFLDATGSGTLENGARAIAYAVGAGIRVSNNSWGGNASTQLLADAIAAARDAGHLFVAAAGNNNSNNDAVPFYPAAYGGTLDNVLTVAALDNRDRRASFSNYGPTTVHLGAPGVEIYSTRPNNTYGNLNGTSMAAPHVAGAAALLWNLYPSWTYAQIREQLLSTVDPVADLEGRTVTGGRLNVDRALGLVAAGPRVVGQTPGANRVGPVGTVRLTFDRPVDEATFTADDVVGFTGPDGAIAVDGVAAVPGTNGTQFDIVFAPQGRTGNYALVLGTDVRDLAGAAMDQNRNGLPGEDGVDGYVARFGLLGPRVTTLAPLPDGPFGAVGGVRLTFNTAVDEATFAAEDVVSFTGPGGDVAVTGVAAVPGSGGTQFDLTFAPQGETGSYTLVLGPDVRDGFGNPLDQNNNLVPGEDPGDRYAGTFTLQGLRVVGATAAGGGGTFDRLEVAFNRPVDPDSFTPDDVAVAGPDGSPVAVTAVTPVPGSGNTRFDVTLAPQTARGPYTVAVGPDVRDELGNALDQNGNLVPGEDPEDRYAATFNPWLRTLEEFEIFSTFPRYQDTGAGFQITAAAARDGSRGLGTFGFGGLGWLYRNAPDVRVAQGDVISVWVRFAGSVGGSTRASFGFGATAGGTLAVELAAGAGQLRLKRVGTSPFGGYFGEQTLASVTHAFAADRWYRVEVVWDAGGAIAARLYDSDGATLLRTVSGSSAAVTQGGIAFNAWGGTIGGGVQFDTVTVYSRLASPDVVTSADGASDPPSAGPASETLFLPPDDGSSGGVFTDPGAPLRKRRPFRA